MSRQVIALVLAAIVGALVGLTPHASADPGSLRAQYGRATVLSSKTVEPEVRKPKTPAPRPFGLPTKDDDKTQRVPVSSIPQDGGGGSGSEEPVNRCVVNPETGTCR